MVTLLTFWVFSGFSFCHKYSFNSRDIFSNYPKFKYNLFLASTDQCLEKSLLL
jgi:hypothetical protein